MNTPVHTRAHSAIPAQMVGNNGNIKVGNKAGRRVSWGFSFGKSRMSMEGIAPQATSTKLDTSPHRQNVPGPGDGTGSPEAALLLLALLVEQLQLAALAPTNTTKTGIIISISAPPLASPAALSTSKLTFGRRTSQLLLEPSQLHQDHQDHQDHLDHHDGHDNHHLACRLSSRSPYCPQSCLQFYHGTIRAMAASCLFCF